MGKKIFQVRQLDNAVIEKIRADAELADKNGMLTDSQLEIIYNNNWFSLFVPEEFGGLARSLPEAVRLEEALAYVDGSVGWVVTLCAGAGLFSGYFSETLNLEIFSSHRVCIAGSGHIGGTATMSRNGFIIDGEWPYASGAAHASHFTGNVLIEETGQVQSFVFFKEEVSVVPAWNKMGLKASAGHSFSVRNIWVPSNRSFNISGEHARQAGAIYRFPFLQLAECTLAANISGMVNHFFELANELLLKKRSMTGPGALAAEKGLEYLESKAAELHEERKQFYELLDLSWEVHVAASGDKNYFNQLSLASVHWSRQLRRYTNELFSYCGLSAASLDEPVNRVWRDINTAAQHALLL